MARTDTANASTKPSAKPRRKREGANKRVAKAIVPKRRNPLLPPLWRRLVSRIVKWSIVAVLLVTLAPFALLALYRIEAVHPISTQMVGDWLDGRGVKREWVALDDVSQNLVDAVTMSEDGRYCAHDGVDWDALSTVVEDALEGERTRGASTIAMQTVKNLFLWSDRSYVRKVLEVPLALSADFILGKRRLLEIYLNIAEWGHDDGTRIYGAQAAARHHFGRAATSLSRRQATLMAVTLPNPKLRDPGRPRRGLSRLARRLEPRAKAAAPYLRCLRT